MRKIIIIAGPTASGKSALAIKLAKKLNTEIISADSMQIYKDMNIGTAKITEKEMEGIKHHLLDVVNPNEEYSVSDYADAAKKIIDRLHSENKIPIICGGTGLYIDSLLYPLSLGAKDDAVREKLQKECDEYGPSYMHQKLEKIDKAEADKVHENNVKRVLRALEIFELTGKTKSEQEDRNKDLIYDTLLICLNPNRDELYHRINVRVDKMFKDGLEKEVRNLLNAGYTFDMQSMQAIGYKEFKDYFDGKITKEFLMDEIKKGTRHYAKRQLTWFKRYDFTKFFDINEDKKIINEIDEFIRK